jgi:hypothetical protein
MFIQRSTHPLAALTERSLWRIARRRNYATENPVLVIVEHTPLERRLRAYGFVVRPKKSWHELMLTREEQIALENP